MTAALDLLTPDTQAAVARFLAAAKDAGYEVTIASTRRTCAEQNGLYAIGRGEGDTRATITNARGCVSWHVLGRAIDFRLAAPRNKDADYRAVGAIGKSLGFKWGGDFAGFYDPVHLEWHGSVPIEDVCTSPTDCDAAVARSFALNIGWPGGGGGGILPWVVIAAGVAAGWYAADRFVL